MLELKIKRHISWTHYNTDNDVISAVDDFLDLQDKTFYENGIKALERRWKSVWTYMGIMLKNK